MNEFAEYRFIKVMRDAPNHRKFRKLARLLDVSPFEALGITVALWILCDTKYPFGLLADLDAESLADSIGIHKVDPDELLKAWVDAGLIDNTDDGLVVHGWMDDGRSGAAAQKRLVRAKKGAHGRHHKDRSSPDCDICMSDASEHAPLYASEHPVAYQGASLSVLDARRETQDARRTGLHRRKKKRARTRRTIQNDHSNLRTRRRRDDRERAAVAATSQKQADGHISLAKPRASRPPQRIYSEGWG